MTDTCKNGHVNPERYERGQCKACARERARRWQGANPDRNRENIRRWQAANPQRLREAERRWKAANPAAVKAMKLRRQAAERRATPAWADFAAMNVIYREAREKGWHVDHILPLFGKTVCGLHCEANLQILPPAENMVKGNKTLAERFAA